MLQSTLTHYWPWNEPDDVAWCGAPMADARQHSLTPTCATCAARLAVEDAVEARLAEEAVLPCLDDDARYAGVALPASPRVGVDTLFTVATNLTLAYARAVTADGRRGRRIGSRR
jgi:hypothetical protein